MTHSNSQTLALAFAIVSLLPSLTLAGMYESYEDAQRRQAFEREAARVDSEWQARGEAVIPEIINALCAENRNFYLRYNARNRLVEMGLPAIRALLQARSKLKTDTLCHGPQLDDAIAGIYCNSDPDGRKSEWNARLALLRNVLKEEPDKALMIISSIAALRQHNDCSQFQPLCEEFLPMISSVLREPGEKARPDKFTVRYDALNAVALIGPPAAPLVKEIIPFLRDPQLAAAAAEALEKIGPSASAAVRELRAAMVRDTALGEGIPFAKALGEIGPAAGEALPDIMRLVARLMDEDGSCEGKDRLQIETAVQVICKLAASSNTIGFRLMKWSSGVTDKAIVGLLQRELEMQNDAGFGNMPGAIIFRKIRRNGVRRIDADRPRHPRKHPDKGGGGNGPR